MIEQIGEGVEIVKCKGHATELDIAEGRATRFTKNGTGQTDTQFLEENGPRI